MLEEWDLGWGLRQGWGDGHEAERAAAATVAKGAAAAAGQAAAARAPDQAVLACTVAPGWLKGLSASGTPC